MSAKISLKCSESQVSDLQQISAPTVEKGCSGSWSEFKPDSPLVLKGLKPDLVSSPGRFPPHTVSRHQPYRAPGSSSSHKQVCLDLTAPILSLMPRWCRALMLYVCLCLSTCLCRLMCMRVHMHVGARGQHWVTHH